MGNFGFGILQQALAVRMRESWFYHGVRWFYQLSACYSQRPINRNAVATAIANKRTLSNNNVFYSMHFINRIIIMIVYDYY